MSEATPHAKGFTGWKLDMIDAMLGDKALGSADFRIAVAVLQRVNQFTKIAIVSDHSLQQTIKRDRKALMEARKRLKILGWLEVRPGRYGRATEYRFLDERAKRLLNNRLDQSIIDAEKDTSDGNSPRYAETNNGEKTPHRTTQHSGEKTPHCRADAKTPHSEQQWGESTPHSGEVFHPLHLQTPRKDSLPLKDMAPEAYEAHVIAFDRWTEFQETAARLEYDEQLTRQEAEHRARILCGFDDADADGWWGAGTTPPTEAKSDPSKGTSDDQGK